MDVENDPEAFPWVSWGAKSHVYEVNPLVVVKVPKPGAEEREQFRKEVEIFRILSHHPPCPQLVSCFIFTDMSIFLEYMRDISLSMRIQQIILEIRIRCR
jgi:serine/threonine protein kinase